MDKTVQSGGGVILRMTIQDRQEKDQGSPHT